MLILCFKISEDPRIFRRIPISVLCYFASAAFQTKSLMSIPPRAWQVFFGFHFLFTTLFAAAFRGMQFQLIHWSWLFLCVFEMTLKGVVALARSSKSNISTETTGEIFFMFLPAVLSHGLQTFLKEKFLHDEDVNLAKLSVFWYCSQN
jgi:hypothetical protein